MNDNLKCCGNCKGFDLCAVDEKGYNICPWWGADEKTLQERLERFNKREKTEGRKQWNKLASTADTQ